MYHVYLYGKSLLFSQFFNTTFVKHYFLVNTFSEYRFVTLQGVSNDGERNNERNLLRRRENLPSYGRQESGGNIETQLSRPVPNQREDRNNRNNNNEARAAAGGKVTFLLYP
jgi:hypothetical protein